MAAGTLPQLQAREMVVGHHLLNLSLGCWELLVVALVAGVSVLGLAWALDQ